MKRLIVLTVVGLAGCRSHAPAARCADVAQTMTLRNTGIATQVTVAFWPFAASLREHATAYMFERCRDDRWSVAATTCVARATTDEALAACSKLLSAEQREAVRLEGRALRVEGYVESWARQKAQLKRKTP